MLRYISLVFVMAAFARAQAPGHPAAQFAGCYEMTSLTWSPPADDIKLIPKRVELLSEPRGNDFFRMRSIGVTSNGRENFWCWSPKDTDKVQVGWGGGLGGFRGMLKRSKNGELAGKIKEWCDSRCGWKKRT